MMVTGTAPAHRVPPKEHSQPTVPDTGGSDQRNRAERDSSAPSHRNPTHPTSNASTSGNTMKVSIAPVKPSTPVPVAGDAWARAVPSGLLWDRARGADLVGCPCSCCACPSGIRGQCVPPVVERRPASGAEPAGRRDAMPTADADSTFPEIGADAPQRRRPAASPQPVHKPQLGSIPTPSSSEFTTGPCRSLDDDSRSFGMDTL